MTPRIATSNMADLTRRFEDRMRKAYICAKSLGYNPGAFAGMVAEHGWIGATRILLRTGPPQAGFERLWSLDRLDLTVECIVLEPEWRGLFDEELAVARQRLDDVGEG